VVVEPPDRGGRLGERLQRLGDPLVVVGTEVTDEQVHVVVGVREHAFERRVDGVRPGGDQPDRRLRVGVLGGVVLAITVVGLALTVAEPRRDGRLEVRGVERGVVRLSDHRRAGEPVGVAVGDHDRLAPLDDLFRSRLGALVVQRVRVEKPFPGSRVYRERGYPPRR